MTKVGTGYVEIRPDFSAFGAGFDREIKAKLAGIGRSVGADITKDVGKALGAGSSSKVKVDVDRNSLTRMSAAIAGAGATGFAAIAGAATSAFSSIASAAGGIGGALSGASGALTSLGPFLTGAGIILATLLLPAAIALGASLAAAAAGAAALGVALAGAFGPVALVGLAIITRLALVVKAVATSQKASTDAASGHAQALDGVRAAMDGVAGATAGVKSASDQLAAAQQNVGEQAAAAYRAFADAVETVKDDLLDVQDAQLGIQSATLSTREAEQALKDFRTQAGAAGQSLDAVFKKFTDVNVDTSGLKKALAAARGAAGGAVSGDDELKLERLILNVRQAKLNEKKATDTLHDSNVKLGRDRSTEADFLQRGIQAYGPYRQAVAQVATAQQGLSTAQRGLRSSQRGLATAIRATNVEASKQKDAFADLTPGEQKFGTLLLATGKALKAAFDPAVSAALGGISRAIKVGLDTLKDPRIAASLKGIGVAVGSVFTTIAREVSRPEILNSFITLAKGGAALVRVFGSRVFIDLERIFLRIARAALPTLLSLVLKFVGALDKLEVGTRNSTKLAGTIKTLTDAFSSAVELGHQFGRVIIEVLFGAKKAGDGLIVSLTGVFKNLADGLSKPEGQRKLQEFFQKSADFARQLGTAIVAAIPIVEGLITAFIFVSRHIRTIGLVLAAVVALFAPEIAIAIIAVKAVIEIIKHWDQIIGAIRGTVRSVGRVFSSVFGSIKGTVVNAFNDVVSTISSFFGRIEDVGAHLGRGLKHGIKEGLSGMAEIGKLIVNGLIDIINDGIKLVNKATPGAVKVLGHTVIPAIPDLPTVPRLALGGLTQGATNAIIGEAGQEAVLPLTNRGAMGLLGRTIAMEIARAPRVAAGASLGRRDAEQHLTQQFYGQDPDVVALKAARRAQEQFEMALDREP